MTIERIAQEVGATVSIEVDSKGAVTVTVTGLGGDNDTFPGVEAAFWYIRGYKRGRRKAQA